MWDVDAVFASLFSLLGIIPLILGYGAYSSDKNYLFLLCLFLFFGIFPLITISIFLQKSLERIIISHDKLIYRKFFWQHSFLLSELTLDGINNSKNRPI
jgi:hypothetical protein